ncbi:MAG: serine hydrolase [Actinomycetota bacterium]
MAQRGRHASVKSHRRMQVLSFFVVTLVVLGLVSVTAAVTVLSTSRSTLAVVPKHHVNRPHKIPTDPRVAVAVSAALASRPGVTEVAVRDLVTGRSWLFGPSGPQMTASMVKVDIAATLLTMGPAHSPATKGTVAQLDPLTLLKPMIENSDNAATDVLWNVIGGPDGLAAFNNRIGLVSTGTNHCTYCMGSPFPGWGITPSTPTDQLTLLANLVLPSKVVSAANQATILQLMEHVVPDQRWGASGGVPTGVTVALKNGWVPLGSFRWQVNSLGWVHGAGRNYLVAMMSAQNSNKEVGVATLNAIGTALWGALGPKP